MLWIADKSRAFPKTPARDKDGAVVKPLKRIALSALTVFALSGCSLMQNELFTDSFWAGSPMLVNNEAELGIAQLTKGNYVTAEGHFQKALKTNPRDIDALIGAGILYQNTGQLTKAREMYEAVLALRPDDSHQFVVWNKLTTRPAAQIASVNLSLLETGGSSVARSTGQAADPQMALAPAAQPVAPVTGAPTTSAMLGRPAQSAMAPMAPVGELSGSDANVISRFSTLRALRDQGLITDPEYTQRRQTNIGALMPLTSPPPAAGLERSVPTTEQISGRLHAIGRALEMRAISVSQHSAERSMILDAMMPSAPVVVANPGIPPRGLMEAADSVRRLEQLRNSGFISAEEYARERQAIELAMRPAAPVAPAAPAVNLMAPNAEANPAVMENTRGGPQSGVHLASYRSLKQAERGWAQIRRAHQAVLGDMSHEVTRVNLGRKGTYFRLKAGPVASDREAKDICGQLKRRRQFCEPSTINSG